MSISKIKPKEPAKHTHYVSLSNGCIYRAMTTPLELGYEDRHPAEWRPATEAEAKRFESAAGGSAPIEPEFEIVDVGAMLDTGTGDVIDARTGAVYDDSADVAAAAAAAASAPAPAPVAPAPVAPAPAPAAPTAPAPLPPAPAPSEKSE